MAITCRFDPAGRLPVSRDGNNDNVAIKRDVAGATLVNGVAMFIEGGAPNPLAVERSAAATSQRSCNDAVKTLTWLLRWCPHQARAFALAMHERAAWQYDDSRTEHWRHVLRLLPRQ